MDIVEQEVFDALATIKKIQQPQRSAMLKENLGIDSIHLVRIITRLTTKLKVNILEFSDQDLVNLKSVDDLIILFNKKTSI